MPIGAPYPGEAADAGQLLALAHAYAHAAEVLADEGRSGRPASWAPFRLTAIHAIELYLNAALLAKDVAAVQVRSMQHDLHRRADAEAVTALGLRAKTTAHLRNLTEHREYLTARYCPAQSGSSQLNRLAATLFEVADKVTRAIDPHSIAPLPARHRAQ